MQFKYKIKKYLPLLNLAILIVSLFYVTDGISQSLEESNGVLFMKANALFEESRYDEAIRLYNRILNNDPNYGPVYLKRAKCKYALGAYKGVKIDILDYVNLSGINEDVLILGGQVEQRLKNHQSATTYYKLLTALFPYEGKYFSELGQLYLLLEDKNQACKSLVKAAQLGYQEGVTLAKKHCAYDNSIHLPPKQDDKTETNVDEQIPNYKRNNTEPLEVDKTEDTASIQGINNDLEDKISESDGTSIVDDTSQEKVIDEELTIILNNGLGGRKIAHFPQILMLSDKSGELVLNVCVNNAGEVISAEIDMEKTTIVRSSLSSMALRKAGLMTLQPSLKDEQCGNLTYRIVTK